VLSPHVQTLCIGLICLLRERGPRPRVGLHVYSQDLTMDPISVALIAAAAAGVTKVGEQAVVDAYNGLKALIVRRFGADSKLARAVSDLEEEPKSEASKALVAERLAAAKADLDPDLTAAAQKLLALLEKRPDTKEQVGQAATFVGNYNRVAQVRGSHNTIDLGDRRP
jgi:hypothetical protein